MSKCYTSNWTSIRGLRLHAYVSTQTPTDPRAVILVHGLGVSGRYLLPTLECLGNSHKVYAPELPGFGQSDKPLQPLDIPALADVLAEWVTLADLEHAAFLGNSMGCQVIVDLAVRYPALLDHAILVGPTIDSSRRTILHQMWRGILDLIHEPWSLYPVLLGDYFRSGTRRMYKTLHFALRDPVEQKCSRMQVPTLLIRGSHDTISPALWLEKLASEIAGARVITIANATHAANYSTPDQLTEVIREFLRSRER